MKFTNTLLPAMAGIAFLAASPAMASFTIANTDAGDGFVTIDPLNSNAFTITGANNGPLGQGNVTTYLATATNSGIYTVRWQYRTFDTDAGRDPAGWYLNGDLNQLTDDVLGPGVVQSGLFDIVYNPGDIWGFYVATPDGLGGAGEFTIGVPEPASWAMFIAGFGLTGAAQRMALRRRRRAPA